MKANFQCYLLYHFWNLQLTLHVSFAAQLHQFYLYNIHYIWPILLLRIYGILYNRTVFLSMLGKKEQPTFNVRSS